MQKDTSDAAARGGPVRGALDRMRWPVLAVGLTGYLCLACIGTCLASLPALLLLVAGRPGAAFVLVLAGMLGAVVVLPVLIAPRLLPPGATLSRAIAPGLHGQLDMMRKRLDAPRLDGIVLDHGFDIRVVFGARSVLSPQARRHLIIGLPLMHALSAAEFRALMAREVAVTSRRHGRITIALAALYTHWQRLLAASGNRRVLRMTGLHALLHGYVSRYHARAGPCMLERERAADRMACAVARPAELAAAILRSCLAIRFIEERVLPDLRSQIRRFGEPASGVHTRFEQAMRGAFDDPRFDRWLVDVLRAGRTTTTDRPAASERIDAIGFGMNRPEAFGQMLKLAFSARKQTDTAAGHYLGPSARHVTMSLEKSWIDQVRAASWDAAAEHTESPDRDPGLDADAPPAGDLTRARSA